MTAQIIVEVIALIVVGSAVWTVLANIFHGRFDEIDCRKPGARRKFPK